MPLLMRSVVSLFTVLFGTVCMTQGFVHSYSGLAAARFFLGVCEVPMFPGGKPTLGSPLRTFELLS